MIEENLPRLKHPLLFIQDSEELVHIPGDLISLAPDHLGYQLWQATCWKSISSPAVLGAKWNTGMIPSWEMTNRFSQFPSDAEKGYGKEKFLGQPYEPDRASAIAACKTISLTQRYHLHRNE